MPFAPGLGSLPPFEFVTKRAAPNQLGKITGALTTSTGVTSRNLTTLAAGGDWAVFGYNTNAASIQRKVLGGSLISALSQVGSVALANFNQSANTVRFAITWTDGTPSASVANENFVVFAGSQLNGGLSFTVPAGLAPQILTIYAALSLNSSSTARAQLTAILSDQSAIQLNNTAFSKAVTTDLDATYTITYAAASDGQTLTVSLLNNTALAQNVQIYAATLFPANVALASSSGILGAGLSIATGALPLLAIAKVDGVGTAQATGAVGLASRNNTVGASGAIAAVATAFRAVGKAAANASVNYSGAIKLASRVSSSTFAHAAMSLLAPGIVDLTSIARAGAARGKSLVSGIAALSARSSGGRGWAAAPVKGVLTLTSASATRGTGMATPTLRLPLASALSAFGRSIANAFGALFLQQPILVDPNYVVQYPTPSRIVQYPLIIAAQYPEPVRSVSYPFSIDGA